MEKIKAIMGKIDSLSIRERGIIFAGMVFIMFALWDSFIMQPQVDEEKNILVDLQMKRAEQGMLNIKIQGLIRQEQGSTDVVNREKLAALKQQLDTIESNVRQTTNHLVSPDSMTAVLQSILNNTRGLELTEIKGLGASPLVSHTAVENQGGGVVENSNGTAQSSPDGLDNAYKHGLLIRLEGDYMATLDYMRALESLEWKFFWENVEYEVIEYPRASIAITLYTLSLEKDWIGV